MRKPVKIVVGVIGAVVLVIVGIFVAAMVSAYRHSLPIDSPRVVETDDYRFDAPDKWITTCADRAPGCLAVLASDYQWNDREYWIEAASVANDVADNDAFVQRALAAATSLIAVDGGKAEDLLLAGDPTAIDGTTVFDVDYAAGTRFSRSRFVRFPDAKMKRFTCYGEKASTQEQDDTCFAALSNLHFPAAAAAEAKRVAELEEIARQAAKPSDASTDQGTARTASEDDFMKEVTRLWGLAKGAAKRQQALDEARK